MKPEKFDLTILTHEVSKRHAERWATNFANGNFSPLCTIAGRLHHIGLSYERICVAMMDGHLEDGWFETEWNNVTIRIRTGFKASMAIRA